MQPTPKPLLVLFSVLAGAQILTAGAALGDVIGARPAALIALLVAAVQAGATFYARGVVLPASQVAAYVDTEGRTVSGPAEVAHIEGSTVMVIRPLPTETP